MKEHMLGQDEILFSEGDPGCEMFIILKGRVAVSVKTSGNEVIRLAEMSGGSFFGEMSLIENLPRSATCTLLESSSFLSLDNTSLLALMKDYSAIAEKILYRMLTTTSSRLFNTSALLSDMVQWGEKARLRVITDEFTGLYNRRFLDDAMNTEFRKAIMSNTMLTVAMVDLDHFGSVNKTFGESFGDTVILRVTEVFKKGFRSNDILARYGGDEFTFLFPGTTGEDAQKMCAKVCEEIAALTFTEQAEFKITTSMGIATFPIHAQNIEQLNAKADKALYSAKEGGRNQATIAKKDMRPKQAFISIAEQNRIFDRIFALILNKKSFLLLGHELPDEDCISSLVSMALLLDKFGKEVKIYIRDQIPEQLSYLTNICVYNKIPLIQGPTYTAPKPDVLFVLDTPKPEMIAANGDIAPFISDPHIPIIEFDHHLSADAALTGTEGYCFVSRATSTCELIGLFCCKLESKSEVLASLGITELFSRNLVLSMLTGMIGDTKFGLTLKTHRDTFFYTFYTKKFSAILRNTAQKKGNYTEMTDIFNSIQSLTIEEKDLYQKLLERARFSGRVGMVILDALESQNYVARVDYPIYVNVIKSVTDYLSEKSGTFGLTVYYDMSEVSNLIQFRIRISRTITGIDLRNLLKDLAIEDGGGHPGAIGFRIPKDSIVNIGEYVFKLIEKIEKL